MCFYSDEDKLDMDGGALFDPHFKPDFNIGSALPASTISAICLWSATIWQRRWAASVRNTTERRIMTSFSVVRRRRRRSAISRRCCITGAATRIRQRATRRASCTHLMRVRARSWIIINAVGIEAERVEKGVDYGIYHSVYKIQGEPLVSDHHSEQGSPYGSGSMPAGD